MLPGDRLGVQLYTVRDEQRLSQRELPRTFATLSSQGYAGIELFGDLSGYSAREYRALAAESGLALMGKHWWGEWIADREAVLDEAEELGLERVGLTMPPAGTEHTVEGYRALAGLLDELGAAAAARGRQFYFHNHPPDHTVDGGTSIYDVLLEHTDPRNVAFELDIAWCAGGTGDLGAPVRYLREQPERFPLLHVKDGTLPLDDVTSLTDVGDGDIDWTAVFAAVAEPAAVHYIVERDDAATAHPPPGGSLLTCERSARYLANLGR